MPTARIHKAARGFGLALTALLVGACAHVGMDQYETDVADLRQRIEDGDRANADRSDGLDARLAATSQQLDDLEGRLRDLTADFRDFGATVERLEAAIRVQVPVYFAFDESELRDEGRPVLERFSSVMQEYYPEALITVEGFTDPAGSEEYNLKLGQARADAVRAFLLDQGLDEARVRSVSYGEDTSRLVRPEGRGPGEPGWENRRVVLVIDGSAPNSELRVVTPSS
jgi:peptidoglycan-associated lipoprotein